MNDKLIKGLALLEATNRLKKLENDTTDPQEKRGIAKAIIITAALGLEITEDK